ncbi:amidase [Nocardia sp. NPDC049526]|uniref:amidase n=1 Tax=Nocardia sp. NPDC049526 TaxID=3364316 RepID=UPI003798E3F9
MHDDEYGALDAVALAAAVARGETTAAELLDIAIRRTAELNPALNAVVRSMESFAAQQVTAPLTGPFAGVPFLLKDLLQDFAGVPTSAGSQVLAEVPAPAHATVVRRWLDAGLVIFGKTNTSEFGAKAVTETDLFGPARNPWHLGRTPGGSSGGAAAAVAAGIVPVAGATDGGGSIRIPAACCGLFGLKPGRGLIPAGPNHAELLNGSATHGVISRSVRDTAAMLDVLRGQDAVPPYLPALPNSCFLDEVGRDPGRLRIGYRLESILGTMPSVEAVAAVRDAADLLTELGHDVEPADIELYDADSAADFLVPFFVQIAADVEAARRHGGRNGGFELDTLLAAAAGRAVRAPEYAQAVSRWHRHRHRLAAFHSQYHLLLTPTLAQRPLQIGASTSPHLEQAVGRALLNSRTAALVHRIGVFERIARRQLTWAPYTQLANITGCPAASVPLYWTDDGLPLGVQFVAPPAGEALLIRLTAQLEAARPWSSRRPPEWRRNKRGGYSSAADHRRFRLGGIDFCHRP